MKLRTFVIQRLEARSMSMETQTLANVNSHLCKVKIWDDNVCMYAAKVMFGFWS
jgi:hypothetical protein